MMLMPSPQMAAVPNPPPPRIRIEGSGEDGFKFRTAAGWQTGDFILDNGMRKGYSVFRQSALVCVGSLVVFDEIDWEMDELDGGPIPPGWVTHFPKTYVHPPADVVARYEQRKVAFRVDFMSWPLVSSPHVDRLILESVGRPVYRVAPTDPTIYYGLAEREKTSQTRFCVGFNGSVYHYPTLASNIAYYRNLLPGHDVFGHLGLPRTGNRRSASGRSTPQPGNDSWRRFE